MTENIINISLLPGERIWSGAIKEGHLMPFAKTYSFDFYANNNYNQLQPLLLSNKGLYVWSEEPYSFALENEMLILTDPYHLVKHGRKGNTLKESADYSSAHFFPPDGEIPDPDLFSQPQYNTWIEMTYFHTQEKVMEYAKGIINNGMPPGVLMIDESWQEDYGVWDFHSGRFPHAEQMVSDLHEMGFKIMLWVVPFISPDKFLVLDELLKKKALLLDRESGYSYHEAKKPAIIPWWNGYSACLDFSSPAANEWFNEQLQKLTERYGIDGFKFDGGDMNFYPDDALSMKGVHPNEHCRLYAELGLKYPLNEYRACWKMGGKPLAQRLHDKQHSWEDLQKLIPHMVAEGLAGYPFSCPDMIGGGDWTSFMPGKDLDQELVVRSAQCHALMPMMQFSVAPWRILDDPYLSALKKAVEIRSSHKEIILNLVKKAAKTGKPVVTNLEYHFPNRGLEGINDQFMLGDKIMVAPVVSKGKYREIVFPEGKWKSDDGTFFDGGRCYPIEVKLEKLPVYDLLK